MSEITIRPASTLGELRSCQDAQRRSWGIEEEGYLIPVATMVSMQHCGGLVLGAFLAGGRAAGVSVAFRGKWRDRSCLYSQLTGVDPDFQDGGIGTKLKLAQREFARSEGDIDLIVWAFDPLHAGNANFNINRLGGTATQYIEDMYGPRTDRLNAGLPTDRLVVEWELDAQRNDATVPVNSLAKIIVNDDPDGRGLTKKVLTDVIDDRILLEIPSQIIGLWKTSPKVAMGWRISVREAFDTYLSRGYRAIRLVTDQTPNGTRQYYVLAREASG